MPDDWEMDAWTTSREKRSEHYRDEEVSATAGGASVSTNFTVVKVDVTIADVKDEAAEESVGAYLACVADTNTVRTIADTNGMAGVKFTCEPTDLPPEEMVTIRNAGHGELYLVEGDMLYLVTSTNLPARGIGERIFLLHGHAASGAVLKDEITIEHPSSKAIDRAFYTVLKIDIDIDSDNDAPDGIPGRTAIEEDLEDVAGHPGRALALNELDIDKDWVPDYADGYDSTFPGAASEPDGSAKFIPLVLECGAIPPGAEVTIRYDENESDPAHLPDMAGNAGAGKVRLWAKDGDKARLKAAAPLGDFIPSGHRIPAAEIANGTLTYFIEAVGGSASPGDVVFTLRIEKGAANVSDAAKATVFHIGAVHPVAADFADGQVGKAMISTKQDDEYYTTNVTTRAGTPAQANDHEVVATAYVLPIPPDGYNPPTVYFEVTDPDDLSPYEGAPSPGAPGDANPNDNNDPAKAMKWNGGAPSDYGVYQTNALSAREDHPRKVVINGAGRYAAETTLRMTDRYAGDNYQMRATLQNPNGNPFDTLSGMTAPFKADTTTSVKASETLIAWKRVYIEQDDMYKRGCTLTSTYSPMPGEIVGLGRLYVDSTADFSISDEVVVFWPNGSLSARVFDKTGDCLVILGPLQKLQKYSGVRLANSEDTYSCDGHFLENAFGKEANGEDGGAFIEFKSIGNPNCRVPKYAVFPSFAEVKNFASFWFDNVIKPNVVCLLVGTKVANRKAAGTTFDDWSICGILAERTTNLEDTVAHELGHRFSIRQNSQNFKHVDNWNEHQLAHNGCDECILSYNRNREDDNVEFCHFCLLTGSQVGASDSLRKVEDK